VDEQPYGMLPLVGKRLSIRAIRRSRPRSARCWACCADVELASNHVPLLDGDLDKAKDILQTGAWSQTAYYRDKDAKAMCMMPTLFSDAQSSGRNPLIQSVISALGPFNYWDTHIGVCNDFLPDPPYSPGYLAGVPWSSRRRQGSDQEASDDTNFADSTIISTPSAQAAIQTAAGKPVLDASQAGPALLQYAARTRCEGTGRRVDRFVDLSGAVNRVVSRATSTMPYVEAVAENEPYSPCRRPRNWRACSIPAVTGRATLGEHVANTLSAQLQPQGRPGAHPTGSSAR
jgi:hypothetical protein